MSMLYLWHPAVSKDGTILDLILTRGDSDQIGGGADSFVSAVARTLNISVLPAKWSIRPFRCNFYSEYWMEDGWEAKWSFVWRLTVHFGEPVTVEPLENGYLGINDIDDYSPLMESYKYEPFACLVIAEFVSEQQALAAANKIVEDRDLHEARRAAGTQNPVAEVVQVDGDFHLRAMIGSGDESFFKGPYPGLVLNLLERSGGILHAEI